MVTAAAFAATAAKRLLDAGIEDAAFEVRCLLEDLGGMPHGIRPDDRVLSDEAVAVLEKAVKERLSGRPLQYILGEWEFLSLRLKVGEGVLIPRPDTELLCETASARLQDVVDPQVLDLCAGSGCVGLGVASLCSRVTVTAVEKSPLAFAYLEENVKRYPQYHVKPVLGDIFTDFNKLDGRFDAILSNPPYIPRADLPSLMAEVQREPSVALDGGADGLDFYRAILERWLPKLKDGGFCAVEIGFDQGEQVDRLFGKMGLKNISVLKDLGGNHRVVIGNT